MAVASSESEQGPVSASHGPSNPSWVHVKAPFAPTIWNWLNNAPPSSHPVGAGWVVMGSSQSPDWATDLYRTPGQKGRWYASSSTGETPTAIIADQRNTCNQATWNAAGLSYRISLTNASGYVGWVAYAHVDRTQIWWTNGTQPTNGVWLGNTKQWAYDDGCWEVTTPQGVHWHFDAYNHHNYSCYYPYLPSASLTQGVGALGAVGANATGSGQGCWTPPPYP